jgi:hypothetical protein
VVRYHSQMDGLWHRFNHINGDYFTMLTPIFSQLAPSPAPRSACSCLAEVAPPTESDRLNLQTMAGWWLTYPTPLKKKIW